LFAEKKEKEKEKKVYGCEKKYPTRPTTNPPEKSPTRSTRYPTDMLKLLFITGWNSPNPRGTGRVAERAETRPNRPVPSPRAGPPPKAWGWLRPPHTGRMGWPKPPLGQKRGGPATPILGKGVAPATPDFPFFFFFFFFFSFLLGFFLKKKKKKKKKKKSEMAQNYAVLGKTT
jgi:hypothetical protein